MGGVSSNSIGPFLMVFLIGGKLNIIDRQKTVEVKEGGEGLGLKRNLKIH